ncbi:STAS/SEC14 domain-containing protein [Pontibacter fetidus]|uniref:STAS/SEC14 domain-containing protein n=1 Tax=Pontibacter fetidus TaxID=2700082 RepID=A0A6B2GYE1_9BACT|nr:STAS/SEC14 domain-containing protein [Pontibacter fetidus]NDK55033.1 hypothetical protein [Pontibacter fetidus]
MLQMIKTEELKSSTGKIYLKIKADLAEKWIYSDWIGYPMPEYVAEGAIAYLDVLKAHNFSKILNDNRNLVGRWDQSLNWIKEVWLPYAVKSGLKRFAHVTHADALATGAATIMQQLVKGHLEMQVFSDLETAKNWLREINH